MSNYQESNNAGAWRFPIPDFVLHADWLVVVDVDRVAHRRRIDSPAVNHRGDFAGPAFGARQTRSLAAAPVKERPVKTTFVN